MAYDGRSITGKNIRLITGLLEIPLSDVISGYNVDFRQHLNLNDTCTMAAIGELRSALNGFTVIEHFTRDEVQELFISLCCN